MNHLVDKSASFIVSSLSGINFNLENPGKSTTLSSGSLAEV
jgi:hypothetical protein